MWYAYAFVPSMVVSTQRLQCSLACLVPKPRSTGCSLGAQYRMFLCLGAVHYVLSVLAGAIDTNTSAAAILSSRSLSSEWPSKMDMLLFLWLIVLGVMIVFAFAGILILMIPIIDPERAAQNTNR